MVFAKHAIAMRARWAWDTRPGPKPMTCLRQEWQRNRKKRHSAEQRFVAEADYEPNVIPIIPAR